MKKLANLLFTLLLLFSNKVISQNTPWDLSSCESQILLKTLGSQKAIEAQYKLSVILKKELEALYPNHFHEIKITYFSNNDCLACWKVEFLNSKPYLIIRLDTDYEFDHPKIEKDIDENNIYYTEISLDINTTLTLQKDKLTYLILQSLVGHPYHPYSKGNLLNTWQEKQEQTNIIKDLVDSKLSGIRKYLFIAPPGFGKSYIFTKAIEEIDRLQRGPRIHLFLSEYSSITSQLKKDLEIAHPGEKIYYWQSTGDKTTIETLINLAQNSDSKPIYIVSTLDSIIQKFKELPEIQKIQFASLLNTLVFDEAHHLPSLHIMKLLDIFFSINQDLYLIGATATPFHYFDGSIEPYFDKSYWAYLSKEESESPKSLVEKMITQLKTAIARGELTRVEKIYFLSQLNYKSVKTTDPVEQNSSYSKDNYDSEVIDPSNKQTQSPSTDFFISRKGLPHSINPIYLQSVVGSIVPLLNKHNQSMIIVSSIDEANRVAKLIQLAIPDQNVISFHTKTPTPKKRRTLELAKSNNKVILVAIKSLDEGVDLPHLTLYIDLNRTTRITTLIQRIGRLTRLANEKTEIEIAYFLDINEIKLQELAITFEAIKKKSFSGNWTSNQSNYHRIQKPRVNSSDQNLQLPLIYDPNWDKYIESLDTIEKQLYYFNINKTHQFYTFEEARALFHRLKDVNRYSDFLRWLKSPRRDTKVPVNPYKYYKNKGWKGWPDFLQGPSHLTQREIDQSQPDFKYFTFQEAHEFILSKGTIKVEREFHLWKKSGEFPSQMPNFPNLFYKEKGWKGWPHFLRGSTKIRNYKK